VDFNAQPAVRACGWFAHAGAARLCDRCDGGATPDAPIRRPSSIGSRNAGSTRSAGDSCA